MSERQQDVLRVRPDMLPNLRGYFRMALNQLNDALVRLGREGFMPEPWLGDEASGEVAAHYTYRAMDGPESSYQALAAYRDELGRIHDTLQRMEDDYRRTEGNNAALWGLKT